MFSFKARHYLPAFLLASAFPRELWMSSHWQCSALAITLENQESGLLLKFQEPEWMPALSQLQKLPVPQSLAPAKPAEGGDGWRTPFSNLVHVAQLSFSWLCWVAQGGGPWGSPIPRARMGQLRALSPFFDPGKLPRHSKVSLLPKNSGLCCANSSALWAGLLWLLEAGLISPKCQVVDTVVWE